MQSAEEILRAQVAERDRSIDARAADLRALQSNWDSYGAGTIAPAINAAVAVLKSAPQLTPCSNGGVQIDWPGGVEIAFLPTGEQDFGDDTPFADGLRTENARLKADAATVTHLRSVRDRVVDGRSTGAELSDAEVAGRVRMLSRSDLDHELVCVMGRDRIIFLSNALAERDATILRLQEQAAKDERAHLSTIDERDAAEDWFQKLAGLFYGVDTEFSNHRGYADIYNDCADVIQQGTAVAGQRHCEESGDAPHL